MAIHRHREEAHGVDCSGKNAAHYFNEHSSISSAGSLVRPGSHSFFDRSSQCLRRAARFPAVAGLRY